MQNLNNMLSRIQKGGADELDVPSPGLNLERVPSTSAFLAGPSNIPLNKNPSLFGSQGFPFMRGESTAFQSAFKNFGNSLEKDNGESPVFLALDKNKSSSNSKHEDQSPSKSKRNENLLNQ